MREGFYGFYYTGKDGSGQILTCLAGGKLIGIDPAGGTIRGTYASVDGNVSAECSFSFPAGAQLVTGQTLPQAITLSSKFELPAAFFEGQIVKVDIGFGPMNARGVFVAEPIS